MTDDTPPTEDQPKPLTPEQVQALVQKATDELQAAVNRYKDAMIRALPQNAQGQPGVNPLQLALDCKMNQFRMDALMLVLERLGIFIALPATEALAAILDANTTAMGRVQIASGVHNALNNKIRQ